jgi:hypothetical protein
MFLDSKDIPDLQRLIHEPQNGGISKIEGAGVRDNCESGSPWKRPVVLYCTL